MARPVRRVLAATALTATLLTAAPAAQAAAPATGEPVCVLIYDPRTGIGAIICF